MQGSIKEIISESFIYGISNALNKFFVILLVPFYTRLLSQQDFGALDLLVVGMNITALILGLQIESGTARLFYEAKEKKEESVLLSTSFWTLWIIPVLGVIFLYLFHKKIALLIFGKIVHTEWIILSLLIIPLSVQFYHNLLIFRLMKRPYLYMIFSLLNVILTSSVALFLVWKYKLSITGIFIGQLTGFVITLVATIITLRDYFKLKLSFTYLKEILLYGVPIVPSVISSWLQNYANRFLLLAFLGLINVAIYSLAIKVASIVLFVIEAFHLAWGPYSISLMGQEGSEKFFSRMLNIYLFVACSIVCAIIIFSDELVRIMGPEDYWEAGRYVGFIATGLVLNGANMVFALGNNIVKKTYFNTYGYLAGAALNLIVLYLTGRTFGLTACCVSYALGALIVNIAINFFSQRNHKIPYSYIHYSVFVIILLGASIWALLNPFGLEKVSVLSVLLKCAVVFVLMIALGRILLKKDDYIKGKKIISDFIFKGKLEWKF